MPNNPVANVNSEVKQAINNSVKASDKPTADDTKGKSHEEVGTAWTKNGTQTVAPAVPGAYKDVKQPGVVEIDPNKAAHPAQQKPGMSKQTLFGMFVQERRSRKPQGHSRHQGRLSLAEASRPPHTISFSLHRL
jgi:hypothetical protein